MCCSSVKNHEFWWEMLKNCVKDASQIIWHKWRMFRKIKFHGYYGCGVVKTSKSSDIKTKWQWSNEVILRMHELTQFIYIPWSKSKSPSACDGKNVVYDMVIGVNGMDTIYTWQFYGNMWTIAMGAQFCLVTTCLTLGQKTLPYSICDLSPFVQSSYAFLNVL
jgi:hypothetical protein